MFARPLIDSVDFSRSGKELRGEIGCSELPRLADSLARPDGTLVYLVRGRLENDRSLLELSITGKCYLKCQRCLGELEYPVDLHSRLLLLPADRLDEVEENDEFDAIEADAKLDVLALVEDELLLGLPFAPKHPEGECASSAGEAQQKANPFAVLAGLKK